jgi:hypothetical protein
MKIKRLICTVIAAAILPGGLILMTIGWFFWGRSMFKEDEECV